MHVVCLTNRSRYIPYVVEVDKLEYAVRVLQYLTPVALPDVTARMECQDNTAASSGLTHHKGREGVTGREP